MVAVSSSDPEIVTRSEWGARPPKDVQLLANPVPYVVIHHSFVPAACHAKEDCVKAMRWMQDFHQNDHGWADIGYNFAVAGDGKVYEGRGWNRVGAHAPKYNFFSIGICLIGDWSGELPPENQIAAAQRLIEMGVREGMISEDYKLVAHRQVRAGTECPGDTLYKEVCKWSHYCETPPNPSLLPPYSPPPPDEDNKLKKRTAT